MQRAIAITALGHDAVAKATVEGMTESGYKLLTTGIPRKLQDVEEWTARQRRSGH